MANKDIKHPHNVAGPFSTVQTPINRMVKVVPHVRSATQPPMIFSLPTMMDHNHADHHQPQTGHEHHGHEDHRRNMAAGFQRIFWVSLVLALPMLVLSLMLRA